MKEEVIYIKIKIKMLDIDPEKIIAKRGLAYGGHVQAFMERHIIDRSMKYTPKDEGALIASAHSFPEPGGGYIKWDSPYAHYQYYGEVYGHNIPKFDKDDPTKLVGWLSPPGKKKHPTGKMLEYVRNGRPQANPLAGSHWVERMMASEGNALLQEVADYAGARAKK